MTDADFPSELNGKLSDFHRSLEAIESALQPLLGGEALDPTTTDSLDRAKLDLVAAFGLNSLFWIYLNINGQSPQDHGIKQELERVRGYMTKVKAIEDKKLAPRLDPKVAKRFVRNALWEPQDKGLQEKEKTKRARESSDKTEAMQVDDANNDGEVAGEVTVPENQRSKCAARNQRRKEKKKKQKIDSAKSQ